MKNIEKVVLDFAGCKYLYDIYEVFEKNFIFPKGFGQNLDALWDSLYGYTREPMEVYLCGVNELSDELKECIDEIWGVLNRVNEFTPNMTFEIIS